MAKTPPSAPDWSHAPTPPARHRKRRPLRAVALVVGSLFALIVVIASCTAGGGNGSPDSGAGGGGGQEQTQPRSETDEADDIKRFTLVDHSVQGIPDVRVEYTINNNSSDPSDYDVSYEVVNEQTDKRVWGSSIFETGIRPGQSATGEDFINIPEGTSADQYEVNVTQVDRTASY